MLRPIQAEHESCCPNCGCVLGQIEESNEMTNKSSIPISTNMFLLGSALENTKKYIIKTPQVVFEENVLRNITNLVQKFGLPDRFVIETFNELKRKKRGLRSENAYIKQLLQILAKDENYIHIHKYRAIKTRYESILNS